MPRCMAGCDMGSTLYGGAAVREFAGMRWDFWRCMECPLHPWQHSGRAFRLLRATEGIVKLRSPWWQLDVRRVAQHSSSAEWLLRWMNGRMEGKLWLYGMNLNKCIWILNADGNIHSLRFFIYLPATSVPVRQTVPGISAEGWMYSYVYGWYRKRIHFR